MPQLTSDSVLREIEAAVDYCMSRYGKISTWVQFVEHCKREIGVTPPADLRKYFDDARAEAATGYARQD